MTVQESVNRGVYIIVDIFIGLFAYVLTNEALDAFEASLSISEWPGGEFIVTLLPFAVAIIVFLAVFQRIGPQNQGNGFGSHGHGHGHGGHNPNGHSHAGMMPNPYRNRNRRGQR